MIIDQQKLGRGHFIKIYCFFWMGRTGTAIVISYSKHPGSISTDACPSFHGTATYLKSSLRPEATRSGLLSGFPPEERQAIVDIMIESSLSGRILFPYTTSGTSYLIKMDE